MKELIDNNHLKEGFGKYKTRILNLTILGIWGLFSIYYYQAMQKAGAGGASWGSIIKDVHSSISSNLEIISFSGLAAACGWMLLALTPITLLAVICIHLIGNLGKPFSVYWLMSGFFLTMAGVSLAGGSIVKGLVIVIFSVVPFATRGLLEKKDLVKNT